MMNGFKGYQIYWSTEGPLQKYLETYIIENEIIFISRMAKWPVFTLEIKQYKQQWISSLCWLELFEPLY